MSTQPQTAAAKLAQLQQLLGEAKVDRDFTPQTYVSKNGSVGCGVKVRGAWSTISPQQAMMILKDPEGFQAAAIEALQMSKRPGELERLIAERDNKAKAKASGVSVSPKAKPGAADLEAMLAQLNG